MKRRAFRSGSFYPSSPDECRKMINRCLEPWRRSVLPGNPKIGIVPHAGWMFSGPTAASVFQSFLSQNPETFLVLGAVHVYGVSKSALYPAGAWISPLGEIEVDTELNQSLLLSLGNLCEEDGEAHRQEHSIEVQIPFIQYLFPKSKIVALMIPPDSQAGEIGRAIGNLLLHTPRNIAILASTDLTHYGASHFDFAPKGDGPQALSWVKEENDRSIIDLILRMQDQDIVNTALERRNACGAGAVAAAVAAAKEMGLSMGTLLDYTTSYDVMPQGRASDFVGYAGIVF